MSYTLEQGAVLIDFLLASRQIRCCLLEGTGRGWLGIIVNVSVMAALWGLIAGLEQAG